MKDLYNLFYLKKLFRTSSFLNISINEKKKFIKNKHNFVERRLYLPLLSNKVQIGQKKNLSNVQLSSHTKNSSKSFFSSFFSNNKKKWPKARKRERIKFSLLRKLRKKNNIFSFVFLFFFFEKKEERNFFFEKTIFQKILHLPFVTFFKIFCLWCLKKCKDSVDFLKFSPNCFFFHLFAFFHQSKKNRWLTKIQIHQLQKSFLQKKTKVVKFFLKIFFKRKKTYPRKIDFQSDKQKIFSNKNFSFFLLKKEKSPEDLKKQKKFVFCYFYVELQFSLFSTLKNFQQLKTKESLKNFQQSFTKNHVLFLCNNTSKKKRIKNRKRQFFYSTFSQANVLQFICKKKRGNKNFFSLKPRVEVRQKKFFFFIVSKKKRICNKIFILFFSNQNGSFFIPSKAFFSFQKKNEKKRKGQFKFKRNHSSEFQNEKQTTLGLPFEKFYDLKHPLSVQKNYRKSRFLNSLNLERKISQIFLDYFLNLNFLKAQSDCLKNWNIDQMIFHQQLKFRLSTFRGKFERKKNSFFKNFSSFFLLKQNFFFLKSFVCFCGIDKSSFLPAFQKSSFQKNQQTFDHCLQQKQNSSLSFFSSPFKTFIEKSSFEKSLFHLFKKSIFTEKKELFSKKSTFFSPSFFSVNIYSQKKKKEKNFAFFQKPFSFCKKFLKNFFRNPIFFLFKNYSSPFIFFNDTLLVFQKDKNCLKKIGNFFESFVNLKKSFLLNVCVKNFLQIQKKNSFKKMPSTHSFNVFSTCLFPSFLLFFFLFFFFEKKEEKKEEKEVANGQKRRERKNLLKLQEICWILSQKFLFLPTKVAKLRLFHLCPFFSTFFGMKSKSLFVKGQKNLQPFLFRTTSFSPLNFDGFSLSLRVQYKKKLKKFFVFDKKPTRENINLHLKVCKNILRTARGQNQLYFMKKLHKEIQNWCQKYKRISTKKIFFYCDSILLKYLWNWARRKHPNKSKIWIRNKYFHLIYSNQWFFGEKRGKKFFCLALHSQTNIQK